MCSASLSKFSLLVIPSIQAAMALHYGGGPYMYRISPGYYRGRIGCGLNGFQEQEVSFKVHSINDDEYKVWAGVWEHQGDPSPLKKYIWGPYFGNFYQSEDSLLRSSEDTPYIDICVSVEVQCITPGSGTHCNIVLDHAGWGVMDAQMVVEPTDHAPATLRETIMEPTILVLASSLVTVGAAIGMLIWRCRQRYVPADSEVPMLLG